jgi:hypothetical protein
MPHSAQPSLGSHRTSKSSTIAASATHLQVQYPEARRTMARDLVNLRALAAFLSRTEIRFDMLSAVEELQKQIITEFQFRRCPGAWAPRPRS